MLAKRITSLQHPNIKHWAELRKSRAYRIEKNRVFIAGEKLIRELPHPIKSLATVEPSDIAAEEKFLISQEMLIKMTGLEEPDGFAAEVELPAPQNILDRDFVLILDQIQDPGNLGTLLRSALALGWEGVIVTPGTVDLFNDKALRAAQGATFRLPYCSQTSEEIRTWAENGNRPLWLADLEGEPLASVVPRRPLALILSSEGKGPSPWAQEIGQKVFIPMQKGVESLNVSAAGAILLYSLRNIR